MELCYKRLVGRLVQQKNPRSLGITLKHPRRVVIQVRRTARVTSLVVDGNRMVLKDQRRQGTQVTIPDVLTTLPASKGPLRIVGVDLTGSEKRPTGLALLCGSRAQTRLLRTDAEIEREILSLQPDIVSIDSPLGLPKGRCCTRDTCKCRAHGIVRECERILWRRGVRVYPCLLPSMQGLTARGIRLAVGLRKRGIAVIESYPGAAQDIMRIPRKRTSLADLAAGLDAMGIAAEKSAADMSHDELDAITAAVVGVLFWSGRFEALGHEEEGFLIVPSLDANHRAWLERRVIGVSGPLAAGKTTAARAIEGRGFVYTRFSLVLATLLRERGREPTREALQAIGAAIHRDPGQRWLCQRLAAGLPKQGAIVVDGLRHPEDHAFFVEQYGPSFKHIHVTAPRTEREMRYQSKEPSESAFAVADGHPVESNSEAMRQLAHVVIENTRDMDRFLGAVVGETR